MKKKIDENIVFALEKVSNIQRILLWEITKEENLSPIQIQFIEYLSEVEEENRNVGSLAMEFDLKKSTVSESIKNLVEKGLIQKEKSLSDSRKWVLTLTDLGKEKLDKIYKKNSAIYKVLDELDEDLKEKVLFFFMKIIKGMFDEGFIQVAKMCINCKNFSEAGEGDYPFYCKFTNSKMKAGNLKFNCPVFNKSKKS